MSEIKMLTENDLVEVEQIHLYSDFLEREVQIDVYLPVRRSESIHYSLLLINDGQDLPKMPFEKILSDLQDHMEPLIAVGI